MNSTVKWLICLVFLLSLTTPIGWGILAVAFVWIVACPPVTEAFLEWLLRLTRGKDDRDKTL